jgi:hypothetical protein
MTKSISDFISGLNGWLKVMVVVASIFGGVYVFGGRTAIMQSSIIANTENIKDLRVRGERDRECLTKIQVQLDYIVKILEDDKNK